ncbi:hypothetical protein ATN89_17655 [Comamonas thiooxydans]|uniref:hypothetical protein n=1 Tax=Comamonas thiooxydans TaxID=363952 RepID=UPI0007C524C4|nr:hypothetical protein [Comamonas thiooxydans]OAD82908.1 hypothetical protein ATN89_17655 [Comamonas thiooxydans]
MTDYFTADDHFGHKKAINWETRPFSSTEEMDSAIITDWNKRVGKSDRVFVLGDFSMLSVEETDAILSRLHGQKFLIKGNHDSSKNLKKLTGWAGVKTYDELSFETPTGRQKVILSHFPFLSWNRMHYGSYHLHGHCHGSLRLPEGLRGARMLDVGIDNTVKLVGHFGPISLDEVRALLAGRGPCSVDQHVEREESVTQN